jgi:hypothetical protein
MVMAAKQDLNESRARFSRYNNAAAPPRQVHFSTGSLSSTARDRHFLQRNHQQRRVKALPPPSPSTQQLQRGHVQHGKAETIETHPRATQPRVTQSRQGSSAASIDEPELVDVIDMENARLELSRRELQTANELATAESQHQRLEKGRHRHQEEEAPLQPQPQERRGASSIYDAYLPLQQQEQQQEQQQGGAAPLGVTAPAQASPSPPPPPLSDPFSPPVRSRQRAQTAWGGFRPSLRLSAAAVAGFGKREASSLAKPSEGDSGSNDVRPPHARDPLLGPGSRGEEGVGIGEGGARWHIRDSGPSWWTAPPAYIQRADAWERGHDKRYARAQTLLKHSARGANGEMSFLALVDSVRRARLALPVIEQKEEKSSWKRTVRTKPTVKAASEPWSLSTSIWAPRAKWADSKSLWDTDEVEERRFSHDWSTMRTYGLSKFIMKHDDGDSSEDDQEDDIGADDEYNDDEGEVADVERVLWEYHDLVSQLFILYAASDDDIHVISLNAWTDLTDDFRLVSKKSSAMKRADLDRLFLAVNAKGALVRKEKMQAEKANPMARRSSASSSASAHDDDKHALSRVEFMVCLVHLACNKHVVSGELRDMSEALDRLLRATFQSRASKILGSARYADSNTFRDLYCYTEPVDKVLRRHEKSLRLLFAAVSGGGRGKESDLLSLEEWMRFLREARIMGADLSERDATLCFAYSRMLVANPSSERGRRHECHLPFEGFLEAIVRAAILKALPTDGEIEGAPTEVQDAGSFLMRLEVEDHEEYKRMMLERKTQWAGEPDQPIERCVSHLIAVIIRRIEEDTAGADDLQLKDAEMDRWCEKHGF